MYLCIIIEKTPNIVALLEELHLIDCLTRNNIIFLILINSVIYLRVMLSALFSAGKLLLMSNQQDVSVCPHNASHLHLLKSFVHFTHVYSFICQLQLRKAGAVSGKGTVSFQLLNLNINNVMYILSI